MAQIIQFKGSIESRWKRAEHCVNSGKIKEALELFESLANDGDVSAYAQIGNLLELGKDGVEVDLDMARRWYMRAIEEDNCDAGYIGLAKMALRGFTDAGTPDDAIEYLRIASDVGNPEALTLLGMMYYFGEHVSEDLDCAAQYFEKACEHGYILPQRFLSIIIIKQGHIMRGLRLNIDARWRAFKFRIKNPHDERLWRYFSYFRY